MHVVRLTSFDPRAFDSLANGHQTGIENNTDVVFTPFRANPSAALPCSVSTDCRPPANTFQNGRPRLNNTVSSDREDLTESTLVRGVRQVRRNYPRERSATHVYYIYIYINCPVNSQTRGGVGVVTAFEWDTVISAIRYDRAR